MRSLKVAVLALAAVTPITAQAMAHRPYPGDVPPGSLVDVAVEVEGAERPLYAAPDGSGRFYFEARRGARYAIRLRNRSHERLGVVVQVDGLNVISGDRTATSWLGSNPGRMYVLDPWDQTDVQGWRTSLDEVRRFTFVEEERSYAARSGQANNKMGWVEIAVYRERNRAVGAAVPSVAARGPGTRPERGSEDARADGAGARGAPGVAAGGEERGRRSVRRGRAPARAAVPRHRLGPGARTTAWWSSTSSPSARRPSA